MAMQINNNQRIYSTIYRNLARANDRNVLEGCEVTEQSTPDMTVQVSSGSTAFDDESVSVSGGNITIESADANNPRFDIIAIDSSGNLMNPTSENGLKGVADSDPRPSDDWEHDDYVVLALVRVNAGVTEITNDDITDLKINFISVIDGGSF